jgi:hypothetical protein
MYDAEAIKPIICDKLANGQSLRAICAEPDMPAASTVFLWLSDDAAFSEQYARAREAQADALFDEILEIADDGSNDWMERKDKDDANIGWRENGEAIRRSALRVDARKWMAAKLQPKKYGDKLDLNHSGHVGHLTDEQLASRVTQLLGKAGAGLIAGGNGAPEGEEEA